MEEAIVYDGPEDRCFGCGQGNEQGLKLRFRRTGEGRVETDYVAPGFLGGNPGVLHGGIQALLLDEVFGVTAHRGGTEVLENLVTVDFRIRYRRPAATGVPLTVRGRLARVDGRDYFLEGEIVDSEGQVLTSAEARWRLIR